MKATKGNKEYLIGESQKKFYQDSGFDILEDDGTMVAYGRGKTVPYEDHMRAIKEIERLQELCAARSSEIERLNAENESLKVKQEPPKTAAEDKKEKAAKKEGE